MPSIPSSVIWLVYYFSLIIIHLCLKYITCIEESSLYFNQESNNIEGLHQYKEEPGYQAAVM